MATTKHRVGRNLVFVLVVILTLMATECNKDKENAARFDELVGTWNLSDQGLIAQIITNSEQLAIELFKQNNWGIEITGEITATLSYTMPASLGYAEMGHGIVWLMNVNYLGMDYVEDYSEPIYMLLLDEVYRTGSFGVFTSETDFTLYNSDYMDFDFGIEEYVLHLAPGNLYAIDEDTGEVDSSRVVTAQGLVQPYFETIPADWLKSIEFTYPYHISKSMFLNDNGTYLIVDVYSGPDGVSYDSLSGEWDVDGDEIHMSSIKMEYNLKDDVLSVEFSESCKDGAFQSETGCLESIENALLIETGSLAEATIYSDLEFVRATDELLTLPPSRLTQVDALKHILSHKASRE